MKPGIGDDFRRMTIFSLGNWSLPIPTMDSSVLNRFDRGLSCGSLTILPSESVAETFSNRQTVAPGKIDKGCL
jgi:hypothetical protein